MSQTIDVVPSAKQAFTADEKRSMFMNVKMKSGEPKMFSDQNNSVLG